MAEREDEPEVLDAIKMLGADAILAYTTNGMEDEDVERVSPKQVSEAAGKLRQAIKDKRLETTVILETYKQNANSIDPVDEEFIWDLEDIEALANWADEGAQRMSLQVNW